jgi:uncharacterized protein (TIGR02265 family)
VSAEAAVTKPPRRMLQPLKSSLRARITYLEAQVDALTQERTLLRMDLALARRGWWGRVMDYWGTKP